MSACDVGSRDQTWGALLLPHRLIPKAMGARNGVKRNDAGRIPEGRKKTRPANQWSTGVCLPGPTFQNPSSRRHQETFRSGRDRWRVLPFPPIYASVYCRNQRSFALGSPLRVGAFPGRCLRSFGTRGYPPTTGIAVAMPGMSKNAVNSRGFREIGLLAVRIDLAIRIHLLLQATTKTCQSGGSSDVAANNDVHPVAGSNVLVDPDRGAGYADRAREDCPCNFEILPR